MPTKQRRRPVWTVRDIRRVDDYEAELLRTALKPEVSRMSVVDFAEKYVWLPQGLSPMPGRFSWSVTPYLEQIAEDLSETSPVQEVYVKKGSRVGYSIGIGLVWTLYTIVQAPGHLAYVPQDQQTAVKNMRMKLRPAIQLSGFGDRIFAQFKKPGNKGTGDTDEMMEFSGGVVRAFGPTMGGRLRGDGYQKVWADELDAWPSEVGSTTGKRKAEGSPWDLLMRRTDEYENTRKILGGSTPLIKGSSLIEPLFLMGDQRRFYVPCKHCGELQPLDWESLKYEADERGVLVPSSVFYQCRACDPGKWKNADKAEFMKTHRQGGQAYWKPEAEARRPRCTSYDLPSLYSPVGFRSWESIAQQALEAGKDPDKLQVLYNTVLGRTWAVTGTRVDYTRIMMRREHEPDVYKEWPMGALFVTIGADVQGGNNPRIEAEVVAWGRNKESWSLSYHVFHGDTSDLSSGAWTGLADLIMREHCGKEASITLVDSGFESSVVYAFCESMTGKAGMVLPSKGESAQSQTKRLYALREVTGYGVRRVDIQTNQLKSELYKNLRREWPEQGLCPPGYCHFPGEYTNSYFEGLTAEEVQWKEMPNGGKIPVWRKIAGRGRNEPHDCRIYAMAALYVLRGQILTELGLDDELVTWEQFWDILDAA